MSIIICINCGKLIGIRKDDTAYDEKKGLCGECIEKKEQEIIKLFKWLSTGIYTGISTINSQLFALDDSSAFFYIKRVVESQIVLNKMNSNKIK